MKNKTITFNGQILEEFLSNDGTHPDYPDWDFSTNTDEGEFDSEKGSMYNYPLYMNNEKTKESYEGCGGYYNAMCGECFYDEDIEFDLVRDVLPILGKKKKYFETTVRIKVYTDVENEISFDDAKKAIKALSNDKFKIEGIFEN